MLFFESPSMDPYFNLALEEYLFQTLEPSQSCFLLWQNENTIVVGNYQNTLEEINQDYVEQHEIRVARRLSGGGAVYHDKGNLNYTFIVAQADLEAFQFEVFLTPLLQVLQALGVEAECNGRNDVTIQGLKFSGSSQRIRRKRLLHHGCIMLDSNLTVVSKALNPKPAKFESKSTKSVRSRITAINEHTSRPVSMAKFKKLLKNAVFQQNELDLLNLSNGDMEQILRLRDEKYATLDWNYGASPQYNLRKERKFPSGLVTACLQVEHNRIDQIKLYGDFFGSNDIAELESALVGLPLDVRLREALDGLNIGQYINGLTSWDFYELLML